MLQDQSFDLVGWWNQLSFPGKDLFGLRESGEIVLLANNNVKERTIAILSAESADANVISLIEKFEGFEARTRELDIEWGATEDKLKLTEKVAHIKELLDHINALGDFRKPALLIQGWENTIYNLTQENYNNKLKLAQLAEELAQSDKWKDAAQGFRELMDKWKQCGHVDKARNDKLWNRIEEARRIFQERKRLHQEDEEKTMLQNLDLKMELVDKAETLAGSEEWKKTTEAFQKLLDEWKAIGPTMNKKNEELWQRFQAAKSVFYDKKKEHFNKIQKEHEHNLALKLSIVERAETLKDSTEWNNTTQAFAGLMEEWKKTGRVPHEKGDDLWKRFTEAQDQFFDAKKQYFDTQRSAQENNYQLKKAIYDRAEEIKNSNSWSDTTSEMIELLEEWKKIGPIPRSYGDKMWEDFNAARKHFFARKDANREQRKQHMDSQKAVRAQYAREQVVRLKDELKEEEEKLADFRNALLNITPGKKAAELRAHLEMLIEEGTQKIKRLQEKSRHSHRDSRGAEVKDDMQAEG